MIGGVAVREAPDSMFYVLPTNGSNLTATLDVEARDARRVQVAVVLTTLVGIIQVSVEPTHTLESCCCSVFNPHRASLIWLEHLSNTIQFAEVFSHSKITVCLRCCDM